MSETIERLNAFLKLASEHKALTLTTSLASLALTYATHFIISAPHEYADHARNQVRFARYELEGERIDLVFQTLQEGVKRIRDSMSFYQEHFGGKKWPEPADDEIIMRAYMLNDAAKGQVSVAVGLLTGLRFENAELETYREQFRHSMQELHGIITTFEQFYLAHGLRDESKAKELLPELRGASEDSSRLGVQLLASIGDFGNKSLSVTQQQTIEIHEQLNVLKLLTIRFWTAVAAILYIVGYVVGVLIAFGRTKRKKESRIVLP